MTYSFNKYFSGCSSMNTEKWPSQRTTQIITKIARRTGMESRSLRSSGTNLPSEYLQSAAVHSVLEPLSLGAVIARWSDAGAMGDGAVFGVGCYMRQHIFDHPYYSHFPRGRSPLPKL